MTHTNLIQVAEIDGIKFYQHKVWSNADFYFAKIDGVIQQTNFKQIPNPKQVEDYVEFVSQIKTDLKDQSLYL